MVWTRSEKKEGKFRKSQAQSVSEPKLQKIRTNLWILSQTLNRHLVALIIIIATLLIQKFKRSFSTRCWRAVDVKNQKTKLQSRMELMKRKTFMQIVLC